MYSECLKSELVWISDSSAASSFQTVWISDTFSVWNLKSKKSKRDLRVWISDSEIKRYYCKAVYKKNSGYKYIHTLKATKFIKDFFCKNSVLKFKSKCKDVGKRGRTSQAPRTNIRKNFAFLIVPLSTKLHEYIFSFNLNNRKSPTFSPPKVQISYTFWKKIIENRTFGSDNKQLASVWNQY